MKIQYGTSLVYPINMMAAQVSVSPNEQNGRYISLATRYAVAMSGDLGCELDLTKLSEQDSSEIKEEINRYKKLRHLIQFGDFYRLKSPFNSNQAAWNFVSKDKKEVLVMNFNIMSQAKPIFTKTKLYGLDPDLDYCDESTGQIYGGDELMEAGYYDSVMKRDFTSEVKYFIAL